MILYAINFVWYNYRQLIEDDTTVRINVTAADKIKRKKKNNTNQDFRISHREDKFD